MVTVLSGTLVAPRGPPPPRPDSPTARDISRDRDLSSSDSAEYPPSRYEDVKGTNTRIISAYIRQNGAAPGFGGLSSQESRKKSTKGNVWSKAVAGKVSISNPILMETNGMANPLNRMPTIDLATAANNEKERRTKIAQSTLPLTAQQPAPQPPNLLREESMLNREASLRRKEIRASSTTLERSLSTKTSKTSGRLSVEVNASSTSSQLSPGTDKIRRRSPRQLPPPVPTTFQPIRPGEPIRIPIPRTQDLSQSLESPDTPDPVKTPLQRRPTTGLPSNPRAQAMKPVTKELDNQRQETIMFVNNIVYDDPNTVIDIVQGASKTPITSMDSADSVVNRPRPIPRKGDKDRQVFPAELSPSQTHKRSKSSGSIASRKSILRSMPGSPTLLPPLPPPPKSAGNPLRPHPNDTKSMTFDEKMDILYITPLSAPSTMGKKRSVVPEVPPFPVTHADAQRSDGEGVLDPEANGDRRVSKVTDRSSIRTTSILGIDEVPRLSTYQDVSSRNAADELGQSWLPGISAGNERQPRIPQDKKNRRSSLAIPVGSHFSVSSMRSENKTVDEDAATIWGSTYSPISTDAIAIQQSRLIARSTYIGKDSRSSKKSTEQNTGLSTSSKASRITSNRLEHPSSSQKTPNTGDDKATLEVTTVQVDNSRPFHHRIGDACPTFSTRKDKGRFRKMPPPPLLTLNGRSTKKTILVQTAEPSPLESPEIAYQMIQAQLQRFEQPNRESVEENQGQGLALLENLEREMGQLEDKWQSSQNRLDRDSMSSIRTSPSESRKISMVVERRASRKVSPHNSVVPSKMEEITVTPDLVMKQDNLHFLPVSKTSLGNLTPPDTDKSGYENEISKTSQLSSSTVIESATHVHALWRPQSPIQCPVDSGLWAGSAKKSQVHVDELPGLSVRPAIRKTEVYLTIKSSWLWRQPAETKTSTASNGLWKGNTPSRLAKPTSTGPVVTRPLTIRPPRRSRRMTLLPDILENPKPLPHQRGSLGIFQFPWGEKSEHATIQPHSSRMAMPGTMTTGSLVASASLNIKPTQIDAEELTTSFFDDYEAEEEGDNLYEFSDSDGEGDDFDETTLWEIASLLKTRNLPSKDIPSPSQQQTPTSTSSRMSAGSAVEMLIEDYRDDGMVLEEPIPVDVSYNSTAVPTLASSLLWAACPEFLGMHVFGLPQPEPDAWKFYTIGNTETKRYAPHIKDFAPISSNELWKPRAKEVNLATNKALLWSGIALALPLRTKATNPRANSSLLWTRPKTISESETSRLFDISNSRADYRKTSKDPVALRLVKKTYAVEMSLETLSSNSLWGVESNKKPSLLWEPPINVQFIEHDGLFSSNTSRLEYRKTAKEAAAISMKSARRTNEEPLGILKTNSLWSNEYEAPLDDIHLPRLFTPSYSKLASQPAKANIVSRTQANSLWEKLETTPEPEYKGLFNVNVTRNDYRRSSKLPAAINVNRSARKPNTEDPLNILISAKLWEVRCEPSCVPISNPISLWSKTTASTLSTPSLFQLDSSRKVYRTTSALPAALKMARKPRFNDKPLAIASAHLWTNRQATSAGLNWISISSIRPESPSIASASTVSSHFGTMTALRASYPRDWEAALQVAIKASQATPRFARKAASPRDWSTALHKAIMASRPQLRFSRGQALPAQWGAELEEAIARSQPPKVNKFDVAVRHPVYMGSLETTAGAVHPAIGPGPDTAFMLWTNGQKTKSAVVKAVKGLWTPSIKSTSDIRIKLPFGSEVVHVNSRKSKTAPTSEMEVEADFGGQGLWKRGERGNSRIPNRDWLDDSMKKRFTRVELRY